MFVTIHLFLSRIHFHLGIRSNLKFSFLQFFFSSSDIELSSDEKWSCIFRETRPNQDWWGGWCVFRDWFPVYANSSWYGSVVVDVVATAAIKVPLIGAEFIVRMPPFLLGKIQKEIQSQFELKRFIGFISFAPQIYLFLSHFLEVILSLLPSTELLI